MSTRRTDDPGLIADPLFIGITRPAMAFGVPYAALLATAVLTVETFLLSRNLLTLLVCVPAYGICRLVTAADARYFELWADWVPRAVAHRMGNAAYWRAHSLAPLQVGGTPTVRL